MTGLVVVAWLLAQTVESHAVALALIAGGAAVLVAFLGLVGVWLQTTRSTVRRVEREVSSVSANVASVSSDVASVHHLVNSHATDQAAKLADALRIIMALSDRIETDPDAHSLTPLERTAVQKVVEQSTERRP